MPELLFIYWRGRPFYLYETALCALGFTNAFMIKIGVKAACNDKCKRYIGQNVERIGKCRGADVGPKHIEKQQCTNGGRDILPCPDFLLYAEISNRAYAGKEINNDESQSSQSSDVIENSKAADLHTGCKEHNDDGNDRCNGNNAVGKIRRIVLFVDFSETCVGLTVLCELVKWAAACGA